MKLIIIIMTIFSFSVLAEEPLKLKGHYFEGDKKDAKFHKDNEIEKFEQKPSILPDREVRERAFHKAELISDIKDLDELDRDLLFYKSKENSLKDLTKEFPKLSPEKLKKLKLSHNDIKK